MKFTFKKFFFIYLGLLVLGIVAICIYVNSSVNAFEEAQPEHKLEAAIESIKEAVKEGTLPENYIAPEKNPGEYDGYESTAAMNRVFLDKCSHVNSWSFEIISGGYSNSSQIYGIYGDGELIARAALDCVDSKTLMGILTANTWEVKGLYPVTFMTTESIIIDIPEDFIPYANGKKIVASGENVTLETKDNSAIYTISGLYMVPEITVADRYGKACTTEKNSNVITVKTNYYNVTLPESYVLYEDGHKVNGTTGQSGKSYAFLSVCDTLEIEDAYGQKTTFKNGDSIKANDVTVTVPSNFTVIFGNNDMTKLESDREKQSRYSECEAYSEMPELVTYEIDNSLFMPELTILDNLGNKVSYTYDNNTVIIKEQSSIAALPSDISDLIDPLDCMKKWALLLTDDLGTKEHGFPIIAKFLIEGSELYNYMYKWTHEQFDINFARRSSTHDYPEFIREELDNFVIYSDTAFSCDAHVKTEFHIISIDDYENIDINSTCYFVKIDGKWYLADYREIISED